MQIGRTSPERRRAGSAKRGFTLVEVIVVLVILAILAAIAIPALTGYIDKAEYTALEQKIRTQRMALQTMISLTYARDNGFRTYTGEGTDTADQDEYFVKVLNDSNYPDSYEFWGLTVVGAAEYGGLADDQTFKDVPSTLASSQRLSVRTDRSGAIKCYIFADADYFDPAPGGLRVVYIEDIHATDDATKRLLAQLTNFPNLESGFNLYHDQPDNLPPVKLN
jgi:prepilin-type N-terminal cleavage/methylation domain-containing protein